MPCPQIGVEYLNTFPDVVLIVPWLSLRRPYEAVHLYRSFWVPQLWKQAFSKMSFFFFIERNYQHFLKPPQENIGANGVFVD